MEAIELDAKALEILGKPGVYMFVRDDLAIYIGSSEYLGDRIFSKRHHKRNETKAATSLILFPCNTLQEALELESRLILDLRPQFNERKKLPAKHIAKLLGITVRQVLRANPQEE